MRTLTGVLVAVVFGAGSASASDATVPAPAAAAAFETVGPAVATRLAASRGRMPVRGLEHVVAVYGMNAASSTGTSLTHEERSAEAPPPHEQASCT